ncbi:MAG TPA: sigma-70 family RNA polymerase sigma factor [Opitutaceae bacterium]|nr:sigma-70 family RNA polymerase sigma factor [Opitutaceae bacterium]HND63079.1 sigma-70 family RNA polymerase sigma factor [Opitutaceae bacterium]
MTSRADQVAASLNAQREAFKAFLAARVGNEAKAEDLLQHGLLKAFERAGDLRDEAKLVPWFYQLLRHVLIDHYRANGASRRKQSALELAHMIEGKDEAELPAVWRNRLCACLGSVIDTLKPQHARLLRLVDLEDRPVQSAARELGLTPNNASVILHRARGELGKKLRAFCGACAEGACLDCTCAPVRKM